MFYICLKVALVHRMMSASLKWMWPRAEWLHLIAIFVSKCLVQLLVDGLAVPRPICWPSCVGGVEQDGSVELSVHGLYWLARLLLLQRQALPG